VKPLTSSSGPPAGRRRTFGKLGATLWLLLAPAGLAGAEEALFAPRTQAGPPRAEASESGERITASSGFFSPEKKADERGRQTLPAPRQTLIIDENQGAAAPEKPYWAVETRSMEDRPYFQAEEKAQDPPYWQTRREERNAAPYWQAREAAPDRPYWEPAPERVEIIVPAALPAVTAPPPAPEPAGNPRTISYFMFQDESGVKHLSNVPVDPRYREFTVTVRLGRGLAGTRAGQLPFTHENLRPIILRAAGTYNLDPALIAAVIKSESAFDVHAVSWAGAQGLMQLMPTTARDMDCADPFDPDQNIMAGSRYLRLMLDTFGGDLTLAIASYNCGPERVRRLWRVPDIPETKNYVTIVSRNYERYKGQF
jgi:soluble lytic murein transglycosylase